MHRLSCCRRMNIPSRTSDLDAPCKNKIRGAIPLAIPKKQKKSYYTTVELRLQVRVRSDTINDKTECRNTSVHINRNSYERQTRAMKDTGKRHCCVGQQPTRTIFIYFGIIPRST